MCFRAGFLQNANARNIKIIYTCRHNTAESCTPKFIFLFEFARMLHTYLNDVVLYRGECVRRKFPLLGIRACLMSDWLACLYVT